MIKKDNKGRFAKGHRGGGRAKGTQNKATRFNKLIEDDIEAVVESIVKDAKNGCNQARKLILDRWLPVPTMQTLQLEQEIEALKVILEDDNGNDSRTA
jgi:hypothetical protein